MEEAKVTKLLVKNLLLKKSTKGGRIQTKDGYPGTFWFLIEQDISMFIGRSQKHPLESKRFTWQDPLVRHEIRVYAENNYPFLGTGKEGNKEWGEGK